VRSINVKVILKSILKEFDERVWTAFISRMILNCWRALVYMVINFQLPKKLLEILRVVE
jgi:hypothetical protein